MKDTVIRYNITIEAVVERVVPAGRDWKQVGEKAGGEPEYGYTPEIEKRVHQSVEVFKQSVDDLNLPRVIMAINDLAPG